MSTTLFSRIASGEISAEILYQDAEIVAFRDISPQAPVHFLVIPRQPIPTLNAAQPQDAALLGKLFLVAAQVAAQEGIAESGYRTVVNCNAAAGQTVFHLHLHVLGGRPLNWPPG
ncbi:histidine triad nucleotide-binding protein [Chromatium weissei]|nr:histidine triad nucleotide-binding protein [Chromatium weissei]